MKLKKLIYLHIILLCSFITLQAQNSNVYNFETTNGTLTIQPIFHGSLVLTYKNTTIYVDPYGGQKLYANLKSPDIVLMTDIHPDHLNLSTLDSINTKNALFITPQAVADKLPEKYKSTISIINNNQAIHRLGIYIKAIPMYNLPVDPPSKKHPKGRGNGYLLKIDNKTIYISGDTEDIPEMRQLRNIDIAFVCMNLPYTMTVDQAASAVLEFQPKVVFPFHYRGANGYSDVDKFKKLVNDKNQKIEVILAEWYPKN
ncbi:MBL fold metallo-hydrolase [Lutibacter holmesii]|uniref:MBL fold metallo-hydrolase n=1 Tax=Lutibacter holmesii TaxID=1137985 RepID=A0ABW3WSI5_9FLAO